MVQLALSPVNRRSRARAYTPFRLLLLAVIVQHGLAARLTDAPARVEGTRVEHDEADSSRMCPQLLPTYSVTPPPTIPPSTTRPVDPPHKSPKPIPSTAAATAEAPAQTPSQSPKHVSELDARIVGGVTAAPGLETSLAFVMFNTPFGTLGCTGALIAPAIVASAAHCNVTAGNRVILNARAGYVYAPEKAPFKRAFRRVRRVVRPTTYDETTLGRGSNADLMLVYLTAAAPNSSVPMLVNIEPSVPRPRAAVRVAGYGATRYNESSETSSGNFLSRLHQVDVPVIGLQRCNMMSDRRLEGPTDFCAGYERGGCDTWGDSGGPVFQFDPSGHPVLVGIVSRGFGCGLKHKPGINTRVSAFLLLFSDKSIVKTNAAVQVLVGPAEPAEPEDSMPQTFDDDDRGLTFNVMWISFTIATLALLCACVVSQNRICMCWKRKSLDDAQEE